MDSNGHQWTTHLESKVPIPLVIQKLKTPVGQQVSTVEMELRRTTTTTKKKSMARLAEHHRKKRQEMSHRLQVSGLHVPISSSRKAHMPELFTIILGKTLESKTPISSHAKDHSPCRRRGVHGGWGTKSRTKKKRRRFGKENHRFSGLKSEINSLVSFLRVKKFLNQMSRTLWIYQKSSTSGFDRTGTHPF